MAVGKASILRWNRGELRLSDFCRLYEHSLPAVIMVAGGVFGADNSHTVSTGEKFFVHGVHNQSRFVLQDNDGNLFGIPVDCPLMFRLKDDEGKRDNVLMTMKEIVEKTGYLRRKDRQKKATVTPPSVVLDSDLTCVVSSDGKSKLWTKMSTVRVIDEYHEKFLLARSFGLDDVKGSLFDEDVTLPTYLDLSVVVANGLQNDQRPQSFQLWLESLGNSIKKDSSQIASLCTDVLMLRKRPMPSNVSNDKPDVVEPIYEPIRYTTSPSCSGYEQYRKLENTDDSSPYVYASVSDVNTKSAMDDHVKGKGGNENPNRSAKLTGMPLIGHAPATTSPRPPPIPRRPVAPPRERPPVPSPHKTETMKVPPLPLPFPSGQPTYGKISNYPEKDFDKLKVAAGSDDVWKTSKSSTMSSTAVEPKHEISELLQPMRETRTLPRQTSDSDAPADDVSLMSIADISYYLHQLKLSDYVDKFRQNDIDGRLLQELDEQILVDEFSMTHFEARKLLLFAKDGWKPTSTMPASPSAKGDQYGLDCFSVEL